MTVDLNIEYKYRPEDGFDLSLVGESFMGFDSLLTEILDIAHLTDRVKVRPTDIRHGSIILDSVFVIVDILPFLKVEDFLEFLKLADASLIPAANDFFSKTGNVEKNVNDFLNQYPGRQLLIELLGGFIIMVLWEARQAKKRTANVSNFPGSPRQLNRINKLVSKGRFKRALKPITQGKTSEIKVIPLRNTDKPKVVFNESNIENYLPDDAQILPEMLNGSYVELTGYLVTLQSSHGDEMKLKIDNIDQSNNLLVGHPEHGVDTQEYAHLYKKHVCIKAEVIRQNLYKRPELTVFELQELQQSLDIQDGDPTT
jgi:hypothetical protein